MGGKYEASLGKCARLGSEEVGCNCNSGGSQSEQFSSIPAGRFCQQVRRERSSESEESSEVKSNIYSLDPWSLPRVAMESKSRLPRSAGLYFVFQHNKLLYIGKTDISFYARWHFGDGHHREAQLSEMSGVSIACWAVPERGKELLQLERAACHIFKPSLNGTKVSVISGTPKNQIAFYATPRTIEDAKHLADLSGQTVSEVYRQALDRGLWLMIKEEIDRVTYKRKQLQLERLKKSDVGTGADVD